MRNYPVLIFDGPDGTGKTTQSLLLGSFLKQEFRMPVAYCSLPVYEFPCGKAIGRCLGRWGPEKQIVLPSPEDMAVLFSLNRLETLPHLSRLAKEGFLTIFNRGPYSNLFSVARRVLSDKIDWNETTPEEKEERINPILALDHEFLTTLGKEREVINLFMLLNPEESMELARKKALSTLGSNPDEYESKRELQFLAAQIYKDITEGKVPGHQAHLIEATRGRLSRLRGKEEEVLTEVTGILKTAEQVIQTCEPLVGIPLEGARRTYLIEISEHVSSVLEAGLHEDSVDFEFRRILGEVHPNLWESRPELMAEIKTNWPGVWQAIKESHRLDEIDKELARSRGNFSRERVG